MFMGLKTFSLLMLIMNLAFVKSEEIRWVLSRVGSFVGGTSAAAPELQPVGAAGSTQITKR
jgi:hypothetical protein